VDGPHQGDRSSSFPGVHFCRFDVSRRLPVLQTPGVFSILGSSATGPIAVDESEIATISAMLKSGALVGPWPFLREGEYVMVERGPLAGVEGFIIQTKANFRLVVSVSLLQRSVYAELDRDWVRPATRPAGLGLPDYPTVLRPGQNPPPGQSY
jgi:transcription antitermination factor NusG